ncbi:MAG: hypothetical protein CVV56_08135 [Tenericutes bacterium HGW-Tenericutes-1]|jgi:hypothetical protein|nr:MAG: hypothetical protein CVV56_08135 [Tenericutes bacterium HGW-Tenericutes-1]PKM95814.1 MAG: hypothetical protein CVU84_03165 [Firmicutes bacterium HGW-Firmicutes-1]
MIIDTNANIKIDFGAIGAQEIMQNLSVLYSTPQGSVAFDREFGIDWSILDNPLPIARSLLISEYIIKTKKYEPRAEIVSIDFLNEDDEALLKPKVVIKLV